VTSLCENLNIHRFLWSRLVSDGHKPLSALIADTKPQPEEAVSLDFSRRL